uniref:Protein KTI12 homolog n=1 Tax=Neogobius melanostomus TaxID=47308 RepID=A0A8C6TF99_9GOBI
MPLIIMCGYPCSGKTQRTNQLKLYLEQNSKRKIHVVGDDTLDLDRNAVYADSQKEKDARGSLKAEVERKVNKDDIVILDSLNYIKGYRYELFCLIKHAQTPHCLVNIRLQESLGQPLFTVHQDDNLPLEDITDALLKRKAPKQNQSTQSVSDMLCSPRSVSDCVIPTYIYYTFSNLCHRPTSSMKMRKLRRQFISYTKSHPTEDCGQITNMFVQYLNKSLH